jgi:acetylornithine deacetylase/succinyl-diaminopimelate desuccinylase-like protein
MKRCPPLSFSAIDIPAFGKTRAALTREWGRAAASLGGSGSIPVNPALTCALGMDVIPIGFAPGDDRIQGPDEKYNPESVHKGMRSWVRVLKGAERSMSERVETGSPRSLRHSGAAASPARRWA